MSSPDDTQLTRSDRSAAEEHLAVEERLAMAQYYLQDPATGSCPSQESLTADQCIALDGHTLGGSGIISFINTARYASPVQCGCYFDAWDSARVFFNTRTTDCSRESGHHIGSGTKGICKGTAATLHKPTMAEWQQSTTAGIRPVNPVNPDPSAFARSPAGVHPAHAAEAADPWMNTQRIRGRRHFNPAAAPALNAAWLVVALSTVPRIKPLLKDVSLYTGADADNQLHQFVPDWRQPQEVQQRRDQLDQAAGAQEADYLTGTLSSV